MTTWVKPEENVPMAAKSNPEEGGLWSFGQIPERRHQTKQKKRWGRTVRKNIETG